MSNIDFIDRISILQSQHLNYHFAYLINVMACEPIGVSYLGQKKSLLKDVLWPMVKERTALTPSKLEKLAIAIFQKFSLKKRFCIMMLRFGIVEWLLSILVEI